jgi:excisionase family DNA binding protein
MTTLWTCPKPDCPPTVMAPKDVEEPAEAAGGESDKLLSMEELAALLHVPLNTLYKWNKTGSSPPYYKRGKHIRYRIAEVRQWLVEHKETLAICGSTCGGPYPRSAFTQVPGNA